MPCWTRCCDCACVVVVSNVLKHLLFSTRASGGFCEQYGCSTLGEILEDCGGPSSFTRSWRRTYKEEVQVQLMHRKDQRNHGNPCKQPSQLLFVVRPTQGRKSRSRGRGASVYKASETSCDYVMQAWGTCCRGRGIKGAEHSTSSIGCLKRGEAGNKS